ncbi:MAG: succinate dehydrogenase, cytochrome b556 subunit [Gammaproteobacteria bacterium]|nr:MAG: succinate dehydrogenase, cytochrome b556 subunit [Gammaproteobacteria bacterium]
MSNRTRPLSPHLTIYRWPLTMILSILHRATGVSLSVGLIIFSVWLFAIAFGEQYFTFFVYIFSNWIGRFLLVVWTFAFFLHFCNGLRHLYWDTGRGFDRERVEISARIVVFCSLLLTSIFWLYL